MSGEPEASALRARILAAAKAEPAPTRRDVRRATWATVIAGFALEVVTLVLVSLRHHGRPPGALRLGMTGGAVLVALAATVLAFGRGRSMVGRPRIVLVATTIAVPLLLIAWMAGMDATATAEQLHASGSATMHGCFELTALFSIGPACALLWARRGSDPVHPAMNAAAIGAAAGAWATVAISLLCPDVHFAHVAIAHCAPAAALSLVAAWLGMRVLALRSAPRAS